MSVVFLLIAFLAAGRIEAYGRRACPYGVDLLFIIDGSTSVKEGNPDAWDLVRQFMHKTALNFPIGENDTKIGLVTYGDVAQKVWNFNENKNIDLLLPAIDNVPYPGGELFPLITAQVVLTQEYTTYSGDRPNFPNVAIVICDGMKNYAASQTGFVAKFFKVLGVKFFVVCVTGTSGKCTEDTAKQIASPVTKINPQTYWLVPDYASIESVRESVLGAVCTMLEDCKSNFLNCLAA